MATATTTHHKEAAAAPAKKSRYTEAVGRRKTAIARVRISAGTGKMTVNGKTPTEYFTLPRLVAAARSPLEQLKLDEYDVSVKVSGGGIHAQADAVRLGLSRAIIAKSPDWKPRLRTMGFLTRDSAWWNARSTVSAKRAARRSGRSGRQALQSLL